MRYVEEVSKDGTGSVKTRDRGYAGKSLGETCIAAQTADGIKTAGT